MMGRELDGRLGRMKMSAVAKVTKLVVQAKKEIEKADSTKEVEAIRVKYLGRKSEFVSILRSIPELSEKERPAAGKFANQAKTEIEKLIKAKQNTLKPSKRGSIDVTLPGKRYYVGNLHPINRIVRDMNAIMKQMGFSVYDGPQIDTDFAIFEALNLPKNHPARDLWDTIYIKAPEVMLRSQTSSLEIHAMMKEKLPIRIVCPGVVFRNEKPNITNHVCFHQYEALAVGEGITMAHLKGLSEVFFKELIGSDAVIRFRCKYYPQVEPGVGIDLQCRFCHGKPGGCQMCKYRGWVEVAGAGMVHVNALRACGIDPEKYTGFAWGMGVDRLAMQKYGIKDIRDLFNGNLVYS